MPGAGELAIVLHTHMPYVEGGAPWPPADRSAFVREPDGFGVWPFGEEWLWEAIATSYVPLLDRVLGSAPITVSLTPVLCDQLEAPGAMQRCITFLREIRSESHARDIDAFARRGERGLVEALERSALAYAHAADRLEQLEAGGGLLAALGAHTAWTSAATHAVLPLLATDAGISLQLRTGIDSHRRRFGHWDGGLWLPECGYASWLAPRLEEAGVRSACVELTGTFGRGSERHLGPLATGAGPVLWPIDRAIIDLVWGPQGYPSDPAYRDHHGLTTHHHRAWCNGGRPYSAEEALLAVRRHARDFVARVSERVSGGGVCVCALDTELLGHWWHEGIEWLAAVVEEAGDAGLPITALDDALSRHEPAPLPGGLAPSSWGEGGDLRTWSGPRVADIAWRARSAELRALSPGEAPAPVRARRELLALQASDWAFLAWRGTAGPYPRERAELHAQALQAALRSGGTAVSPALRNLAPFLT